MSVRRESREKIKEIREEFRVSKTCYSYPFLSIDRLVIGTHKNSPRRVYTQYMLMKQISKYTCSILMCGHVFMNM